MVRSLSHPTSVPLPKGLDPTRIAGNTLAVLVHVVALGLLVMPSRWSPPDTVKPTPTTVVLFEEAKPIEIPPTPPPPQPVQEIRQQQPTSTPTRIVETAPPAASEVAVFEQGEIEAPPVSEEGPAATGFDLGPVGVASLAYDVAPAPRYPRNAARALLEGTVVLRVLVDETGRPLEVLIEQSSGHRELDRAAQRQVLERWRFHPAQRNGRAVQAYGLVPVEFRLP